MCWIPIQHIFIFVYCDIQATSGIWIWWTQTKRWLIPVSAVGGRKSSARFGILNAKSSDEDVDDDDDEDEYSGYVLQDVQPEVHALVVQVPLHCKQQQEPIEKKKEPFFFYNDTYI